MKLVVQSNEYELIRAELSIMSTIEQMVMASKEDLDVEELASFLNENLENGFDIVSSSTSHFTGFKLVNVKKSFDLQPTITITATKGV